MNLTNRQRQKLEAIIAGARAILLEAKSSSSVKGAGPKRLRRSGKDLIAFRKMLVSERKKGVPVADLAKKHNVSIAYIYKL